MPADYSIKLDVLRALVAERHRALLAALDAEEAMAEPDAVRIAEIEDEVSALPWWGTYPDEAHIDAEIQRWQAIIEEQRRSRI